ncbi:MAG: glycosyltransferase [Coriobacteriaceae bacterium]|nr:glycosyltransferase [Coriobacteriaceae bacterium]
MENSISVIVPIFNAAPYLEQCLDSILCQNQPGMEVICLNDGSTDDSLSIMQAYANANGKVRVIDKPNEGYGATCNRGIAEARGHWISIIEPDDWIRPGMYSAMLAYAGRFDEEPDIVKTPYLRVIDPDTPQQTIINCSYRGRVPGNRLFRIQEGIHLIQHHPSIWSALYRKDFLDANDIRFKPIPGAGWADNPFLMETMLKAQKIAYLDKPFYCYREETEEKSRAVAVNNTMLPFDRWHDMMDIIEELGVTDEVILRAHYRRGFIYLSGVYSFVSLEDERLSCAIRDMFGRMDPALVLDDPEIPPFDRKLFAKTMGIGDAKISGLGFAGFMLGRGLYFMANTGLPYTARMVKGVLKRQFSSKAPWQETQYGERELEEKAEKGK